MLHIALYEPEIPPNTGNIIRLAANTGAWLHLIKPLGFSLEEKHLKRAGLDYHDLARLTLHENYAAFRQAIGKRRLFAIETWGTARYDNAAFADEDVLLFGRETRGLPKTLTDALPAKQVLRLPMQPNNRSINLSNSCAIVVFEAWRQLGFSGSV